MAYDRSSIEKKWQERWERDGLYRASEEEGKEKIYVLDMFPYPSGEGFHVGHPKGYIATDIYARKKRMQGFSVLHPMGWDAFGLPAENYALKNKTHPREAVKKNIANFKAQLAHIGFDYDWTREINTTDPEYYKWTQWIFLKLFEQGLAYQSNEPISWCPSCMTGLANEDLDGNVCERCGTVVEKKRLPQWVLKITAYADRMLADLSALEWPEHIKEAQRNWIGRSEGAELRFDLTSDSQGQTLEPIKVFTTRPDTIYGATYLVLAPEHPLVAELMPQIKNAEEVRAYAKAAEGKTEIERGTEGNEKTGVKLEGVMAINPATKEEIPVYIADYVLASYGTGAIMAVPAHDDRDFAFAQKMQLPIRQVVMPRFLDTRNPPQEGKENTTRKIIIGIVRNPKNNTYLCLKWKQQPWTTFITGGIDDGEGAVETARREIEEETGYTDLSLVRVLGGSTSAEFYAIHKDVNRITDATPILFDLVTDARVPVSSKELEQYEPVWLSATEVVAAKLQHAEFDELWRRIQTGMDAYTGQGILMNSGEFSGRKSEEAKWEITEAVGGKRAVRYKIKDWVFSRQRYWGEPIPIIHCEKDGAVAVPYEDLPVMLPEVDHYEPTGTGESPLAAISDWVNTTCPKCGGSGKRETNTMPQWAGSSWYYLRFMDPHNSHELVSAKNEKHWAPVDVYVGGDHAVRHLIYARFWHKFLYDIAVVSTTEPFARLEFLGFILAEDGRKMSKRLGNVINPDEVVAEYGADAFRACEMFMGPFENTTAWSTASIAGTARFFERLWSAAELITEEPVTTLNPSLHQTIKKIGDDIEAFKFNTAVSQAMIFLNALEKEGKIGREQWSAFLRLLAPFAPHITEELWERLGQEYSIHRAPWPTYDPAHLVLNEVEVVVQVAGKKRGSILLRQGASEAEATSEASKLPAVIAALGGKKPARVVYVPNKIINFVV